MSVLQNGTFIVLVNYYGIDVITLNDFYLKGIVQTLECVKKSWG